MRVIALILAFVLTSSVISSNYGDHSDAALRQFHRAIKTQKDGRDLLSLAALRTLRDPDLRPFFHHFVHQDWAVQVHAVLGLAELSEDQTIDPWLVQQIAPTARALVIAHGLDDGLFQKEQIKILLNWPLLETAPRLLLLADLQRIDNSSNTEILMELSNNTDLNVAMFAALLSGDSKSIENTTQSLRRATQSNRSISLQRTFLLIRQYNVRTASTWLLTLLEENAVVLTDQERYWTLYTLLAIDKESGLQSWVRAFPTEPEHRDQLKYLLMLLESGVTPTAEHVARLHIDLEDSLLGLMVKAGNVNKEKSQVSPQDVQALSNLVKQGHPSSTEWAFRVAKEQFSDEFAEWFYQSLATIPERPSQRRKDVAIKAFIRLIGTSPETAWKVLQNAKDDSEQQQLLLLAMLQIPNEDIVKQASKLKRIGWGKADIMTLLLVARGSSPLQENDQERLGIIAAGGGHLSPALETQAAWLYLKRMGLADKALAAVRSQDSFDDSFLNR